METVNIVLCGLGGQGILFMTKVLAQTALKKGLNIMGAETHGMAQRGGSVVSHLRLGEAESSLVRTGAAHYLLALEEHEGYRNLPFLSQRAGMYVNAEKKAFPRESVKALLDKWEVNYHAIAASAVALELGAPLSANLALIGFLASFDDSPFTSRELRETIDDISPERFKALNLKVFDAGLAEGKKGPS